jgi:RimJ/RimL family protein N-acetyltransferase
VTYWIDRAFWGRGLATAALREFVREEPRPLHARVAKDNVGSRRVLEKCGFVLIAEERGFANARGAEIDELVLRLG